LIRRETNPLSPLDKIKNVALQRAALVKRIYRTFEIHRGPRMWDLPDLLVDWNRTYPIRRAVSPKIGTIDHIYQLQRLETICRMACSSR
jgi:hypothetical protein